MWHVGSCVICWQWSRWMDLTGYDDQDEEIINISENKVV